MTISRPRKVRRMRGSHTHGGGAKKKRRGAGHRGGRGMAGSGKRAHQKQPSILKEYGNTYFGRHGFKRPAEITLKIKAVNVNDLEAIADRLVKEGKAKLEGGAYVIDLGAIGYDKLLGSGKVTKKFRIKAKYASSKAVERVRAAGGEVETPEPEEELIEEKQE